MTRTRIALIWTIALATSATSLTISADRALAAHRSATRAIDAQLRARAAAEEVERTRAALPAWTLRGPPAPLASSTSPSSLSSPHTAPPNDVTKSAGEKATGTAMSSRCSSALAAVGLPSSAITAVQPDPETVVVQAEHAQARRARVVLTLDGLSLPQFGAFLDAWRRREPGWAVTGIDLTPLPPPAGISTGRRGNEASSAWNRGGDAPLHAVVSIEYLYVAHPPKSPIGVPR